MLWINCICTYFVIFLYFTIKLKFTFRIFVLLSTGPSDPSHPNKVRVTITIPHRDGLLPVLSTRQLSNFEFILTHNALRVAQHKCSNLLDISDLHVTSGFGFVANGTRNIKSVGLEPYQFSTRLRGEPTLRFYRYVWILTRFTAMWIFCLFSVGVSLQILEKDAANWLLGTNSLSHVLYRYYTELTTLDINLRV